ncbi:MAG: serine/threonine protein kinase [Myxococcales bacterium]|nr:serine/threonine protein kinase [Myxococcales bacterium]
MSAHLPNRIGPYAVEHVLDHGGTSAVMLARHRRLDRAVAIKLRHRGRTEDEGVLAERFRLGAILQADLDHPNIARVFDYIESDAHQALILEYLGGGSVESALQAGPLPIADAVTVAIHAGLALEYGHGRGVVHRDIKPGNLMFADRDRPAEVRVNDYGVARSQRLSRDLTRPGANVGTVWYMPPEQFDGGTATPLVDVYALGSTLYEMLCGVLPFERVETAEIFRRFLDKVPPPPLRRRNPEVPPTLAAVVEATLALDPQRRIPSAGTLAVVLRAVAEREGVVLGDGGERQALEGPAMHDLRAVAATFDGPLAGEVLAALSVFEARVAGIPSVQLEGSLAVGGSALLDQMVADGSTALVQGELTPFDDDDDDDHTLIMMPTGVD